MRNAFASEITRLAAKDPRIVLLSGDIGNRLFDKFKDVAPGRFLNCGVAEANMMGVAAGMAMSGLRPVCYTITPFVTYRCMEQIRVDVCYHRVPVVIVGTGSGLAYASLGATHHSCEEMGMLRLLPHLAILAPADEHEVRACLAAALTHPDPVYIRIGKKGEPVVHKATPAFAFGQSITLRAGHDVALLVAGTLAPIALAAADLLAARGISARVESCPCVKPLPVGTLREVFAASRVVATLEEHSTWGGFGGAVSEWFTDQFPAPRARLLRLGTTPDEFLHVTAEQDEAREHYGLTAEHIAAQIAAAVGV